MEFVCKQNCGECCGIVPIPTNVWNKSKDKINKAIKQVHVSESFVFPITEDLKCCFLGEDEKCLIYDERPEVCRKYGQCDELPCPYIKKNGHLWTEGKAKQIRKRIDREVDKAIKISNENADKFGLEVENVRSN